MRSPGTQLPAELLDQMLRLRVAASTFIVPLSKLVDSCGIVYELACQGLALSAAPDPPWSQQSNAGVRDTAADGVKQFQQFKIFPGQNAARSFSQPVGTLPTPHHRQRRAVFPGDRSQR
jgi:hypothetical protein